MAIDTPSAQYNSMKPVRDMIEAIMGGTQTMRKAGKKYLPQEPNESDKAYDVRLRRSTFFNAYKKAVRTLVGKPFSEPLKTEGFTPELEEIIKDVDLTGRSLQSFAKDVFFHSIKDGITFILVDFPSLDGPVSVTEQRRNRIRPYLVQIDCRRIIGWRYEIINGQQVLTEVRITETIERPDPEDDYNTIPVQRVRLLRRDSYEIWELQRSLENKQEYMLVETGVITLGEIPLVAVYTNREDFFVAQPPLLDLADLNIEHWQSRSDQSTILHVARVPILFGAGIPGDESGEITIGPNSFTRVENPSARLEYVEHSGKAIEAGRQEIIDIEQRMKILGMEPLVKNQIQTATEKSYDRDDFDCELAQMVASLEEGLEHALEYCAKWLGQDYQGDIEIFDDFAIDLSSVTDLEYLWRARQQGDLPQRVFLEELKRRKVLSATVDIDEAISEAEIEGGPLGRLVNTAGAEGNANLSE